MLTVFVYYFVTKRLTGLQTIKDVFLNTNVMLLIYLVHFTPRAVSSLLCGRKCCCCCVQPVSGVAHQFTSFRLLPVRSAGLRTHRRLRLHLGLNLLDLAEILPTLWRKLYAFDCVRRQRSDCNQVKKSLPVESTLNRSVHKSTQAHSDDADRSHNRIRFHSISHQFTVDFMTSRAFSNVLILFRFGRDRPVSQFQQLFQLLKEQVFFISYLYQGYGVRW